MISILSKTQQFLFLKRLVWFQSGRSLITANICKPLSMLSQPSLSKASNALKNSTYRANFKLYCQYFLRQNNFAINYAL